MSIESEKNFINELKFDGLKDKIKLFFLNNFIKIVVVVVLIALVIFSIIFVNFYRDNKLENYNNKIYEALNSNNKIENLEKIYNDSSTPRISKTIAGFNLVDLYTDDDKKETILKEIYEGEKDLFFKYYSALAIFTIEINKNNLNNDYLNQLMKFLEKEENPLRDLFLEQKALYLIKIDKKEEADKILNSILNSSEDENLKNRVKMYL